MSSFQIPQATITGVKADLVKRTARVTLEVNMSDETGKFDEDGFDRLMKLGTQKDLVFKVELTALQLAMEGF